MKSFITLILAFIFISGLLFSQPKTDIPSKIHKLMLQNNDFDPESGRHHYVAWGVATSESGKKYYWYSFVNSDAYYQFRFTANLSKKDSTKIVTTFDGLKRPYETQENWVGASNDWAFSEYSPSTCYKIYTGKWYKDYNGQRRQEYYEVESLCAATTKYAKIFRKIFKKFEVAAVNPSVVHEYDWALK